MTDPRPSVMRLVKAIAREEFASVRGGTDSEVAQRIVTRLRTDIGKLIGLVGFDVSLTRSLVLAQRSHPVLVGITAGPDGRLQGFDDPTLDAAAVQAGATAILCHFIELLVVLIGEDLAMRLVCDVWPVAAEKTKT